MYLAYRAWRTRVPVARLARLELAFRLISTTSRLWLLTEKGQEDNGLVFTLFEAFSTLVDHLVAWFDRLLLWMTWVGTTVAGTCSSSALRRAARRADHARRIRDVRAHGPLGGEHADALAHARRGRRSRSLVGIPLGIVAGRSDRFARAITPVLDAMQIVPAFAYLMPVVILFSVGPAAAVVSTMIYAIPPAIRITALGIRGVAVNTVEAATSMGATRSQLLRKVQLPLARRMILLGVNQTILFALSMVVIAGLIGGGGLGDVVTNGLYSNPALAILAGLVIVVLAIALDRSTEAIAARTDPAHRHLDERRTAAPAHAVAWAPQPCARDIGLAKALGVAALYPDEVGDPTPERDARGVAAREDPGRPRLRAGPDHVGLRDHGARSGSSSSSSCCCRCSSSSWRRRGSPRSPG